MAARSLELQPAGGIAVSCVEAGGGVARVVFGTGQGFAGLGRLMLGSTGGRPGGAAGRW